MKNSFWRKDWFAGLLISIVFVFLANNELIQGLERTAYDFGVKASSRDAGSQIAIIAIDDQSLDNLGRWPWPRDILADMISKLSSAGAKVIGNTILISESEKGPDTVNAVFDYIETKGITSSDSALQELISSARRDLNKDAFLGASIEQAGNVIMGMQFDLGEALGNPDQPLPDYVLKNTLTNIGGLASDGLPYPAMSATPPIANVGNAAAGLGQLSFAIDIDGGVRTEILAINYFDDFYPSLALQIAAHSLNLGTDDVQIELGKAVNLGKLTIQTDPISRMYPFFYQGQDGKPAFSTASFYDVYAGKIKPEAF